MLHGKEDITIDSGHTTQITSPPESLGSILSGKKEKARTSLTTYELEPQLPLKEGA